VESDGLPYSLFSFSGLLPWTFFAQGVAQSAETLVAHQNLIQKVFFPRLILPLSAILAKALDLAFGLLFLTLMMLFYGATIHLGTTLYLPAVVLYLLAVSAATGIWLSALNVRYRDVHHLVPFVVQIGLFVTPVIYPASRVAEKLAEQGLPIWLYGLNPMVGAVESFRWAVFGGTAPIMFLVTGLLVTIPLLVVGVAYFDRMERTFADIV
jgi:lipopolysaccharide transport system permease protein